MPNWYSDDDRPGCNRGDWGPNFCNCSSCVAERAEDNKRRQAQDDEYRRQGVDPDESVMPLFIPVDDATLLKLQRMARGQGCDVEILASILLKQAVAGK